jgi:hypothetical protein
MEFFMNTKNKIGVVIALIAVRGLMLAILATGTLAMASDKKVPTSPVTLNLAGKNLTDVTRGSYLVNAVANCGNCHSLTLYKTGTDPYKGDPVQIETTSYLSGGKKFSKDTITSANLTPDPTGKPAGLTLKLFVAALTKGEDPENATQHLSVHPWPIYKNITATDAKAIYEYLKAIPPLPLGVAPTATTSTTPSTTGSTTSAATTTTTTR